MVTLNPINVRRITVSKDTKYNSFDDVVADGRDPKYNNQTPEGFKNNTDREGLKTMRDKATALNAASQNVVSYGYGIPKKSKKEYLKSKK
jgi:hypothetical protein